MARGRPARLRVGPRARGGHDAHRHARHGARGRQRARAHARRRASAPTPATSEQNRALADVLERAHRRGRGVGQARPRPAAGAARGGRRRRRRLRASPSCFAGVVAALRGEEAPAARAPRRPRGSPTPSTQSSTYRYCTNFAVTGERPATPAPYVAALEALGDSVLVVGDAHDAEGPRPHRRARARDRPSSPAPARSRASTSPTCTSRSRSATGGSPSAAGRRGPPCAAARWPSSRAATACRELFAGLGAHVLDGGPTLNPSTYELLAGIHEVPAEEVVVLPEQPQRRHGRRARRRAVGEGRPRRPDRARSRPAWRPRSRSNSRLPAAENAAAMRAALEHVRTGRRRARGARGPRRALRASATPSATSSEELVAWGEPERDAARRCSTGWPSTPSCSPCIVGRRRAARRRRGRRRSRPTASSSSVSRGGQPSWWWLLAAE